MSSSSSLSLSCTTLLALTTHCARNLHLTLRSTGNEESDRKKAIDPFLVDVGKLYGFDLWSNNKAVNKLFLWVTSVEDRNVLTSGFVDMSASPVGKERPRMVVFEVKKRG